jgi:SAM-dependent methyltransferase
MTEHEAGHSRTAAPEEGDRLRCEHPLAETSAVFSARDYITGEDFMVRYCRRCGLHVTTPVPAYGEIGKYYPHSYYGSGRRFMGVVEWLLDRLHSYRAYQIEQHQRPGKVLDVGCGRGDMLHILRQRGWDPLGTELSEDAAAYARDHRRLPVIAQPLEEIGLPSNEFDLVILWHVLEHVPSPRDTIREAARILKPGGTLLVAVPNFGSWEARWSRDKWFHLDVPRHLTHFTPRTLNRVLEEAGVPITSVNFFSTEYDFFSFVQTVESKLGFRHNLLYNLLRTRSAKVLDEHGKEQNARLQSALALILAVPLAAASLLYAPLIAAMRRGATIAAYATKKESD